jgi:hypothetical protein
MWMFGGSTDDFNQFPDLPKQINGAVLFSFANGIIKPWF